MSWTEERTYGQDVGMGFTLEMTHADGGRVEHQFRAESLDDVLMYVGYFVRGCGFVVDATDTLEFVPEYTDSETNDSTYESGYRFGYDAGMEDMQDRAEQAYAQILIDSNHYIPNLESFNEMIKGE